MTRRRLSVFAAGAGVVLALLGGPSARGGAPADAQYIGSVVCRGCHRGTDPQLVSTWAASAHAFALWKAGESTGAGKIVATFSPSPPFTQAQVAYVVGIGHRQQAFLGTDLKTLPGRWEVKSKSWGPQPALDAKGDCLGCHTSGYDPAAGTWKETGVGCEMCHGPGSTHAAATDKKATITRFADLPPARQAMACAQCHARGLSKNGKYPFPLGFRPGDDLDQVFTLSTDTATWTQNAQYNQLRLGGGKHLAAGVVCTTCHDPHGSGPWLLRDAVNPLCLKCHQGKLKGPQHGDEVLKAVTCDTCHMPGGSHTFVSPHST